MTFSCQLKGKPPILILHAFLALPTTRQQPRGRVQSCERNATLRVHTGATPTPEQQRDAKRHLMVKSTPADSPETEKHSKP